MDIKEISELIEIIEQTQITEFSIETEGMKISIKRNLKGTMSDVNQNKEAKFEIQSPVTFPVKKIKTINSPMLGIFHAGPSPDAEPFVKVGDIIEKGQILCVIESMKMMNEVCSDSKGKVVKIFVKNGETVEFGQPLFEIEEV